MSAGQGTSHFGPEPPPPMVFLDPLEEIRILCGLDSLRREFSAVDGQYHFYARLDSYGARISLHPWESVEMLVNRLTAAFSGYEKRPAEAGLLGIGTTDCWTTRAAAGQPGAQAGCRWTRPG
jgi:hypothetical protein